MALTQRLELRTSQSLVMTPQLQQAIKLLQLSNLELATFIETELEQNPLLERDERPVEGGPVEAPASTSTPAAEPPSEGSELWHETAGSEGEGKLDLAGDPEAWRTRGSAGNGDNLPGLDQTLVRPLTLRDHLFAQLSLEIHDPAQRIIASHLIELVDEAGYLQGDLLGVAQALSCPVSRVEATLTRLQRFDPPGIFARTLAECLALQLKERDRFDPAMQRLIANLPLVASRDMQQLMRICQIDAEDLSLMLVELKALDPKPGLMFDEAVPEPVTPDIFLRHAPDGGWAVELNNDTLPRLLVNNRYYAEVSAATKQKEEKDYLAERYQSANWLVKALHQRATTILKVSREIVRQQEGFLRHGVQQLRPLVLRDIAQEISMHESTVSRVTSNKYMLTPRGTFELKYFFTTAIQSANGHDALSSEAVRFRIKTLIDGETHGVLSDDGIVAILIAEGIDIARRTVAKYRESMHIPSSVQRRREKLLREQAGALDSSGAAP
jgi:RNA polymerase sigma-54 factor